MNYDKISTTSTKSAKKEIFFAQYEYCTSIEAKKINEREFVKNLKSVEGEAGP